MQLKQLKIIICLLLGFLSQNVFCYEISEMALKKHVALLSSKKLEGRLAGSPGERKATEYIANVFQNIGLEPAGNNGTYYQCFNFILKKPKENHSLSKKQTACNVLAKLQVNTISKSVMIIGAHGDHLGYDKLKKQLFYGADDNASGVASVLEAAKKLSELKKQNKLKGTKNIIFAIWSGEELGSLGSAYYIKQKIKNENSLHSSIDAYINLDMVGRFKKNLFFQGVDSSSQWIKLVKNINQNYLLPLIFQKDSYLPTDSTSFYLNGVPAINFFTGAHNDYHTPRDKPELLNFVAMKHIANFLVDFVMKIEAQPKQMNFQQAESTHHVRRGFKAYLGTIPDYASADTDGVKLAGVAKGSPADRAGLKQNDVIVELAGKKIHDIYEYSSALSSLHVGQPAALVCLRGQQQLYLMIVAQARN